MKSNKIYCCFFFRARICQSRVHGTDDDLMNKLGLTISYVALFAMLTGTLIPKGRNGVKGLSLPSDRNMFMDGITWHRYISASFLAVVCYACSP